MVTLCFHYQTQVLCIACRFFIIWATTEAQEYWKGILFLLQGNFLTQESNQSLLYCSRFFINWATREACNWQHPVVNFYSILGVIQWILNFVMAESSSLSLFNFFTIAIPAMINMIDTFFVLKMFINELKHKE